MISGSLMTDKMIKVFLKKEKISKAQDWDSYLTYKLIKMEFILQLGKMYSGSFFIMFKFIQYIM